MNRIEIIGYKPEHQPHFERLNREWIEEFFVMEDSDTRVLTKPDEEIITKGGAILMATFDGEIAGTVGLKKMDPVTFEFTKMAVDKNFRRRGIAEHLSYASFIKAKELGAETVVLFSNSLLKGAILLYEKIGFRHVPVTESYYVRSDVKMVIDADEAEAAARKFFSGKKEYIH